MATKKSGTIRIDFSKEEEGGGGRILWKEGDYHVKITSAKTGRSEEKDTPFLEVNFLVLEGKRKGKKFSERLYITPKSLKRIRLLLEAVGVKVPKSAVNLPLAKLKGKTLWIELETQERDGYDPRSRIAFEGFMSEDDYEDSDDDDDDDDEDDDDLDDEDEDEDDEEEDEDDEDEDDEDEDDDDEDEDEEPAPKKRRQRTSRRKPAAKKKTAPAKKSSKRKKKVDDDEIEDLDLDDL